jgi:hypothetical protein
VRVNTPALEIRTAVFQGHPAVVAGRLDAGVGLLPASLAGGQLFARGELFGNKRLVADGFGAGVGESRLCFLNAGGRLAVLFVARTGFSRVPGAAKAGDFLLASIGAQAQPWNRYPNWYKVV